MGLLLPSGLAVLDAAAPEASGDLFPPGSIQPALMVLTARSLGFVLGRRSTAPAGGFAAPAPPSGRLPTWPRPRATPAHRRRAWLQSSLHHLPVRRVGCQPGCPAVWQKRHARTPSVPPGSSAAYPAAAGCAPGAPGGTAAAAAGQAAVRL